MHVICRNKLVVWTSNTIRKNMYPMCRLMLTVQSTVRSSDIQDPSRDIRWKLVYTCKIYVIINLDNIKWYKWSWLCMKLLVWSFAASCVTAVSVCNVLPMILFIGKHWIVLCEIFYCTDPPPPPPPISYCWCTQALSSTSDCLPSHLWSSTFLFLLP